MIFAGWGADEILLLLVAVEGRLLFRRLPFIGVFQPGGDEYENMSAREKEFRDFRFLLSLASARISGDGELKLSKPTAVDGLFKSDRRVTLGGELSEEAELMELARSSVGSPLTLGTIPPNDSLRFVEVLPSRFL